MFLENIYPQLLNEEGSSETSETFRQTTGVTSQKIAIFKEPHGVATPTLIHARSVPCVLVFETGNMIKTTKLVVEMRCLSCTDKNVPIPSRKKSIKFLSNIGTYLTNMTA
jgi:hypothetical protein